MSDRETLLVYAQKAQEYDDLASDGLRHDPLLVAFIDALPKGAKVLDLGCGPGTAAHVMADAGLGVTATDAVTEMVALADTHPKVNAHVARFEDLRDVEVYDGIWANFSLLHAPRADMPHHLTAMHRALKPRGLAHVAVKTGSGEERDKIGRNYNYYTDETLTTLMTEAGFTVTDRATGRGKGLSGVMADWIALRAHA